MTARSIPVAKPFLRDEEAKAAGEAILSGWVTQGPRVEAFESAFAAYTTAPYAVATSSCTTAIHLALHVAGIGAGDEVICPTYSFIASANAIYHAGATPVFADVSPLSVNMDLKHAESLVTAKTRAVLLVHQLGMQPGPAAISSLTG
jgi:dTDP-4-amino-4,6-dideoxygalactose transaminase